MKPNLERLQMAEIEKVVESAERSIQAITGKRANITVTIGDANTTVKETMLIEAVIKHFDGITYKNLMSRCRMEHVCIARHILCYFLYAYHYYSYKKIADKIGRDHTTIIHSIRYVREMISIKDCATMLAISNIKSKLYSHESKANQCRTIGTA